MHLTHESGALSARDASFIDTDIRVVRWIAQAAINVELFTIPLYMTTLYSITGMHPITGQGNSYYKGRIWPGAKPSYDTTVDPSKPGWANKQAFNIVFSVFIQEMLHLQMAGNLATAIGAKPCFTDTALQDHRNGWTCYGPTLTTIPNIVDLQDTDAFANVKVDIGPLDDNRIQLFLAIELPQDDAENDIVRNKDRYFPKVPFDHGDPDYDPATADILFGSIGYMYQCYKDYLQIRYTDGSCLWDHVFNASGQQNDLFNNFSFPGHPMREFMGFETTIALTDKDIAFKQALNMMNAITDQGEGATLKVRMKSAAGLLKAPVEPCYRSDDDALKSDYPSFSDAGEQIPSADAKARYENDGEDHYGRFQQVLGLMQKGGIQTWDQAGKAGNWAASDLVTADFDPSHNPYDLASPEAIADALNNIYAPDVREANFRTVSQAVIGAIKGVTTVLDQYWNPKPGASAVSFPFPSMVGSGDRMSTCWAAFGRTPDLSIGIDAPNGRIVNHACQGLAPSGETPGANSCAETPIYHSCRGSNLCKGQGGCGFVQPSTGGASSCRGVLLAAAPTPGAPQGGSCSAVQMRTQGGLCPTPTPSPTPSVHYTVPSDNICGGFGGCAVPISALQVYPRAGTMDVYELAAAPSQKIGEIQFQVGDKVEDIAFKAFAMVVENRGEPAPVQQPPNDLRLAFPPST